MVPGRLAAALAIGLSLAAHGSAQVSSLSPPRDARSYFDEGARDLQEHREAEAADAFVHALALDPQFGDAYAFLGTAYYRMGRIPDSIAAFDHALQLDPRRTPARINRAISLAAVRRLDEALGDLAEARRLAAGNAGLLNQVAVTYENNLGRPDEALAVYREAAAADPAAAPLFHNIGLLEVRRGRYAAAVEAFSTAVRIDPAMRNAWFFLAQSNSRLMHYPESTSAWTRFLELVHDGPDATVNRAWDYLCWGGHGREASADARHFLEVTGWGEERSPYMALVDYIGLRENGDADAARLILDEAAVKLPSRAWPYAVFGYLRGQVTEGELLRAADSNDKQTEAHAYIGIRLWLDGRTAEAKQHLTWVTSNSNSRVTEFTLAARTLAAL